MKNVISLGFFCSPAMELERLNIKNESLPFDWLITPSTETVFKLINNNFEDFTNENLFYQLKINPLHYRNVKYNIDFYHDFDCLKSFAKQYPEFKEKYDRRIKRFFVKIKSPSLFLRYVSSDVDLNYIQQNYSEIEKTIKKYNSENQIIFILNKSLVCNNKEMLFWYVEPDKDDIVARMFMDKCQDLKKYILDWFGDVPTSQKPEKAKNKRSFIKKTYRTLRMITKTYYRHTQRL